jgi:hypothetical protein
MNITEYLLDVLKEECLEVGKDGCKSTRFGLDDIKTLDPTVIETTGQTNRQRLVDELNDLMGVIRFCVRFGIIPANWQDTEAQKAKITKVISFMHYSQRKGTLQHDMSDPRLATTAPFDPDRRFAYLAVPYTHAHAVIREERYQKVNSMAAHLIALGWHIFSPISHTHSIAADNDLPLGWDYWQEYDRAILEICTHLIVYTLDGWNTSAGVRGEMAIAQELSLPILYVDQFGQVTDSPRT